MGYDYVHVCVDDYSRLAYVEVLPNERATTAIAFLRPAIGWFAQRGVRVQAVMSDNGSAYRSKLATMAVFAATYIGEPNTPAGLTISECRCCRPRLFHWWRRILQRPGR